MMSVYEVLWPFKDEKYGYVFMSHELQRNDYEVQEHVKEMFFRYYMQSDVCSSLKFATTQYCVAYLQKRNHSRTARCTLIVIYKRIIDDRQYQYTFLPDFVEILKREF